MNKPTPINKLTCDIIRLAEQADAIQLKIDKATKKLTVLTKDSPFSLEPPHVYIAAFYKGWVAGKNLEEALMAFTNEFGTERVDVMWLVAQPTYKIAYANPVTPYKVRIRVHKILKKAK